MNNQLTIKQAIEQGYTHCGLSGNGFQALHTIEELQEHDLVDGYILADKEGYYASVCANDIMGNAVDWAHSSIDDIDDTETIRDAVKSAVNWEEIAEKINSELSKHAYYRLTDIQLIPQES